MFINFLLQDSRLIGAWFGALMIAMLNKFGFNITEYELWKIIALDILTAISLIVVIGYTIARWRKLNREKKPK